MSVLLYRKQYTHLKVLKLRYCGRNSIIQVRIDLTFIMVPLGEQKQMEEVQTYKKSCRYVTYSRFGKLCLIIKEKVTHGYYQSGIEKDDEINKEDITSAWLKKRMSSHHEGFICAKEEQELNT